MRKIIITIICLVLPTLAHATSRTVCNSGCDYTTIAAALTAVGSGNHTVTVNSPYSAAENLDVTQSGTSNGARLLITAANGYTPVIKTLTIEGNNTTFNGFKFSGATGSVKQVTINGGLSNITFSNNEIAGTGTDLYGLLAGNYATTSSSDMVDNLLIQGNTIHDVCGGQGVLVFVTNSEISGNTFYNLTHDPIRAAGKNIIVHHNEAYGFDQANSCNGGDHLNFIQAYGDNGWTFCNVSVYNNYVHDGDADAFMTSQDSVAYTPGSGSTCSGIGGWTFYNNVFANLKFHPQVGIPNVTIYNNVFYNMDYNDEVGLMIIGNVNGSYYNGINCTVKNNIFLSTGDGNNYQDDASTDASLVATNNYVGRLGTYDVPTSHPPKNTSGISGGNPYFVNPVTNTTAANNSGVAGNYALQVSSGLIDHGTTISSVTDDYAGTARPQGTYFDIGAYEYTSGGSVPVVTFTLPSTYTSLTVPITAFTATNTPANYCITTVNSSSGCSWVGTAPTTVTGSSGANTFYAWAENGTGVSSSVSQSVTITLPSVTGFIKGFISGAGLSGGW